MSETDTLTIIGISPGTKLWGIAVLSGRRLIDWRVKKRSGMWSDKKLKKWILTIDRLAWKYGADVIVIKRPHPARTSENLTELIEAIISFARKQGIAVRETTIEELKDCFLSKNKVGKNKECLMAAIAERHPQLYLSFKRENENRNVHYIRLFEAVASTLLIGHTH